jgi:hypothetical protein
MFTSIPWSDQETFTLFLVGTYLVVAPLVLASAALAGYLHRASRPVGVSAPPVTGWSWGGTAGTAAEQRGADTAPEAPRPVPWAARGRFAVPAESAMEGSR